MCSLNSFFPALYLRQQGNAHGAGLFRRAVEFAGSATGTAPEGSCARLRCASCPGLIASQTGFSWSQVKEGSCPWENTMKVFHGSYKEISKPLVDAGRPNLDFGRGFYLTANHEQASSWTRRCYSNWGDHVVSIYQFDYRAVKLSWRVKVLCGFQEWRDFVLACRTGISVWQQYDVVQGAVADSGVIRTIELYTAGLLQKEEALSRIHPASGEDQICIHEQEIIDRHLRLVDAEYIIF